MQIHLKKTHIHNADGRGSALRLRRRSAAQRGQTIIIALLVLVLLAFLGGLFATIVTRNLTSAGRANRVQSADYYAQAGIHFADEQLTNSLDGADWRPPLQFQLSAPPQGAQEKARYTAAVANLNIQVAKKNDPDYSYLVQGFARYNIGGGRFLLRVTYDPVGINNPAGAATPGAPYSDPRARYIKIESVGREGTIDASDPTTYNNQPPTALNATLIQYKAIGITDYARFETNPDRRSGAMALGVSSQFDQQANGIVTPGVYDFNGGANQLTQYPIITVYGASDAYLSQAANGPLIPNPNAGEANATVPAGYSVLPGGGSIHSNGSLRFYGVNEIYLDNNGGNSGAFGDSVGIAGDLLLDNYQSNNPPATDLTTNQDAAVVVNPPTGGGSVPAANYVAPSNDVNGFDTHGGLVRDGNGGNDANGYPRSVNQLAPPTLDTVNPATNLPRYAAITQNSPTRVNASKASSASFPITGASYAPDPDASQYGYGRAIYVDNSTDLQPESSKLVGGYTLIDEWLHRAGADSENGAKSGWVGSFYRPPGVDITLGRQVARFNSGSASPSTASFYGVRLTRTDVDGAGNLIGWKDPNGNAINGIDDDGTTRSTMTIPYRALDASNQEAVDPTSLAPGSDDLAEYEANPDNDVVIYAEGNVRVHGVVSAASTDSNGNDQTDFARNYAVAGTRADGGQPLNDDQVPRHVTIVTNGTAYIDGSILKGNPESTITILAHDYVCVNTTQFLAGTIVDQNPYGTTAPGAFVGDPSLHALDFSASDEELLQEFSISDPQISSNPALYVSGGPSAPGGTAVDFDIINPRTGLSLTGNQPFLNPVVYAANANIPTASTLSFGLAYDSTDTAATDLTRATVPLPLGAPPQGDSQMYQLAIRRDEGANASFYTQDYLLQRAAILPMNIRIEAVLYAETRSFFVIPGDWFNTDSSDNLTNFANSNGAARSGVDVSVDSQNRFPFFGQPIDMKIIIDGAVSEARPADISAQSSWMAKWGWIPQFHGGLGTEDAGSGNRVRAGSAAKGPYTGLQIIYDPLAGFPYYTDTTGGNAAPAYMRTDRYGRPLPYSPKLPVCTGLLYAGQNTAESVLQ